MMLQSRIQNDIKTAMIDGDTRKRDVLRMIESAVKNAAIEKNIDRVNVDDGVVTEVLRRAVKQRKDSVEQFERGNRFDLADREKAEIVLLNEYLPELLGEDAVREVVRTALVETGASSVKDFGKVMGKVMKATAGLADGEMVKAMVRDALEKTSE